MSKEWDPEDIFDVLASKTARDILALASARSVSADDLTEHCDTSEPTVYRRLNALVEHDLLAAETRIDPDGHHYRTFETNLDRICFVIEDGSVSVDVERRRDLIDKFEGLWSDLERSTDDGEE